MNKLIKVRSIIFTEACPLNCRYCDLQNDKQFHCKPQMTKEQIFELVEQYNQQDNPDVYVTRILFSGGEPFLYWEWIKEIILKYQNRFQYSFNTSGYCFTEEILEFLSHYQVSFVLSVDGGEKLTNYLRPVKDNFYKTGYYKKLKEILPTLLFHFPKTPFRIIVHPRYVDLLYQQYLEAEKMGFRFFTFILDFETRPEKEVMKDKPKIIWQQTDTIELQKQFDLILQEIIFGFYNGIRKPQIVEINNVLKFLLEEQRFSTKELPCQVFNNRTLTTLYGSEGHHCMYAFYPDLKDAEKALNEAYQKQNHKCPKDDKCPAFEYCAMTCCPQLCLINGKHFFEFDDLECALNKVVYLSALKLLNICNETLSDNFLYIRYLKELEGKR